MVDYLQRAKFFRTKKRLGQNFLINPDVISDIIKFSGVTKDDVILEIGAGAGFVTEELVKYAKKVIAVELDEEAVKELQKLECDNLEIIHNDILKTDISSLADEKVKIVANIPYYITSPIIVHLLGEIDDLDNKNRNSITDIILMVQEEVARRIAAAPDSPSKTASAPPQSRPRRCCRCRRTPESGTVPAQGPYGPPLLPPPPPRPWPPVP